MVDAASGFPYVAGVIAEKVAILRPVAMYGVL
jgi:hypothetical protein